MRSVRTQLLVVLIGVGVAGVVVLASWLVTNASARAQSESEPVETSAWARINGGEKQSISTGDVLYIERLPDGTCGSPSFSIGMLGDVLRVESHIDKDKCALVIRDVILNSKASMFD
jgi:hypothetical protein